MIAGMCDSCVGDGFGQTRLRSLSVGASIMGSLAFTVQGGTSYCYESNCTCAYLLCHYYHLLCILDITDLSFRLACWRSFVFVCLCFRVAVFCSKNVIKTFF